MLPYILCIGLAAALIAWIIYYNKQSKNHFEKLQKQFLQKLNDEYANITTSVNEKRNELKQLESDIATKTQFNQQMLKIREEELNRVMQEKYQAATLKIDKDVEDWAKSAQEIANENYVRLSDEFNKEIIVKKEALDFVVNKLHDYQAKVDAANQDILRRRALEEKQDFYRVQLTNDVKEDIEILKEIKTRLHFQSFFNKFVYDNYISRPVKEMIKRVLEGKNPSGIYKVTNIKTNEVYIGKSVKIADRWQNHIKSAYGLEGVAESQFQRALKNSGVENFTWEFLEAVEKDQLTDREKYWINFYDTKTYGYNQREG